MLINYNTTLVMANNFGRNIFFVVAFLTVFFSCVEKDNNVHNDSSDINISKQSRLDSLLKSPVIVNSSQKRQRMDGIDFFKSYMLAENTHSQYFQDSIIRYSSLDGDVVELLKNKHQEEIVYLRFKSEKLKLRYGIYIGMSMDHFFLKMPKQEIKDNTIVYDSEYSSLKFSFDIRKAKLSQVFYTHYMD